jgi:hypothetical protein
MNGQLPPSKLEERLAWERRERLNMGVRIARALDLLDRAEALLVKDYRMEATNWLADLQVARRQDFGPFTAASVLASETERAVEAAHALEAALGRSTAFLAQLSRVLNLAPGLKRRRYRDAPPKG